MALRCWSQEESLCSGTMASTITPCLDLKPAASWERTFMFAKMAPDLTFFQKVSDFNKFLLYWCLKENKTAHMSSDGGIVVSTAHVALFCIASVIIFRQLFTHLLLDFLAELFEEVGLQPVTNDYVLRETVNKKEGLCVPRVFLQSKFSKPSRSQSLWMLEASRDRKDFLQQYKTAGDLWTSGRFWTFS